MKSEYAAAARQSPESGKKGRGVAILRMDGVYNPSSSPNPVHSR